MSDVFEEVEDSLRQDKATELWNRFGLLVWIAGISLVAFVAWWEYSTSTSAARQSDQVQVLEAARDAVEAGDYAAAETDFRSLIDAEADVAPLAGHLLAGSLFEGNGDAGAAMQTLEQFAGSDDPLSKLALLKAAYLGSEDMNLEELEAFLAGLNQEESALGLLALELVAAKAFADGDLARARQEFSYLRLAANAPAGVVQRAELALSVIPIVQETGESGQSSPVEEVPAVPTPEASEEAAQ